MLRRKETDTHTHIPRKTYLLYANETAHSLFVSTRGISSKAGMI